MRKSTLTGRMAALSLVGGLALTGFAQTPAEVDGFAAKFISPDGTYIAGMNTDNGVTVYNTTAKTSAAVDNFYVPNYGSVVANNGTVIGTDFGGSPAFIYNGNLVSSELDDSSAFQGISGDGSLIFGFTNWSTPTCWPVTNGQLGTARTLDFPENLPNGEKPRYVYLYCVNEDGTIAVGYASDGGMTWPVAYINNGSAWTSTYMLEDLYDEDNNNIIFDSSFSIALSADGSTAIVPVGDISKDMFTPAISLYIAEPEYGDGWELADESTYTNLVPTQVFVGSGYNNYTVLASDASSLVGSYILLPEAWDFITMTDYLTQEFPYYASWIDGNLDNDSINTVANEDLTGIYVGAYTSDDQFPMLTPSPTYVFTTIPAGTFANVPTGGNAPGNLGTATLTWDVDVTAEGELTVYIMGDPDMDYEYARAKGVGTLSGNTLSINLKELCTGISGTCYIVVPAGIVKGADGYNPKQASSSFKVYPYCEKADITGPADGLITITWPEIEMVAEYEFNPVAYLTDAEGNITDINFGYNASVAGMYEKGNGVVVNLENLGVAYGNYTLTLKDGALLLWDEWYDDYLTPGQTYSFLYYQALPEGVVIEPQNVYSSFIGNVSYTWDYMQVNANNLGAMLNYKGLDGETASLEIGEEYFAFTTVNPDAEGGEPGVMLMDDDDAEGNVLVVYVSEAVADADVTMGNGEFTLTLNANIVSNAANAEDMASAAPFTFYVYPIAPYAVSYDFTESNGKVTKVTISWEHYHLALNETASEIFVVDDNDRYLVSGVLNANRNALEITMPTNLEGNFTIILPEAYVFVGGDAINAEEYIDYGTLTGVGSINAAEDYYRVYDLQGRNVLNSADATAVKNLAPGLYIINGRKVVVK